MLQVCYITCYEPTWICSGTSLPSACTPCTSITGPTLFSLALLTLRAEALRLLFSCSRSAALEM
jgi:hypothetical protein